MSAGTENPDRGHDVLRLALRNEQDLLILRQRTRQLAAALGYLVGDQARLVAALSEIGNGVLQQAAGAEIAFALERGEGDGQQLGITVSPIEPQDDPAANAEWEASARPLVSRLEMKPHANGAAVVLYEPLPNGRTYSADELREMSARIAKQPMSGTLDELRQQNRELLRATQELRTREQELSRVNQELTQTNSGVLALYDELETLHRVGMILAQRHNLHDLLQTIIDATTELTGADLGAFYYHEVSNSTWHLHAFAGRERGSFARLASEYPAGFFGDAVVSQTVNRVDEIGAAEPCDSCVKWAESLASVFPVRSCLFVPVTMENSDLAGALVFGHVRPGAFTERSERIVSAIAVQAAVGIEKARLFQGMQTASEAKDRFLAMLSHELRTPLNPVSAILSSLASDPEVPERYREDVAVMRRNIDLEARIIDDLLDFNRIIRGKLQLHRSPLDFHRLIDAVIEMCEPEIEAQELRLERRLFAERADISGDAARLQQVLWNILKNAIKFTPAGGTITIASSLDSAAGPVRVQIADTGCGIDSAAIPMIFSAFDQGHLPAGVHGGLGLGLSIAKTFMDLHGGLISAFSAGKDRGTQFTLTLPLLPRADAAAASTKPGTSEPATKPEGLRILLVEDHADTVTTLIRLLGRRGHTVIGVTTSKEALSAFSKDDFDLVISDLGLPDRSGLELIADIQRIRPIPAIALSGYGMEVDVSNAHTAGFTRHLTKPVDFSQLETTIRELGKLK